MIDNSAPAWPQSGLSQAAIVYEVRAEWPITRLLAFFCEGAPQVVGPVRSLRTYMLDIAREYHAVVAHTGQSTSALGAIMRGTDPVINQFWQSRKSRLFWRDLSRPRPHNMYTSIPVLREHIRRKRTAPADHWATGKVIPESRPTTISIPYGRAYHVEFSYDPATNLYRRSVGGRQAIDALTGDPITVGSVIIQYARWWQTYEGLVLTSRLELVGSGSMIAFTAGHRIDGRWNRSGPQEPTIFADLQGDALLLQRGPVWVNIVPLTVKVDVRSQ